MNLRVNLLPVQFVRRRSQRHQREAVAVAMVVALLGVGAAYGHERQQASQATQAAQAAQVTETQLQAQTTSLQRYVAIRTELQSLLGVRASVYAHEIRTSVLLNDLAAVVPNGVAFTQFNLSTTTTPAVAGGTKTPADAPGSGNPVATMTITGQALSYADVAGFLKSVAAAPAQSGQPVFMNPWVSSLTKAPATGSQPALVSFSATVDLGAGAYSHRFQQIAGALSAGGGA